MDTLSALVSTIARQAVALDQAEAAYLAEKKRADDLAAANKPPVPSVRNID